MFRSWSNYMSSNNVKNKTIPVELVMDAGHNDAIKNQKLRLKEMQKRLSKSKRFKVGQIVKWKKGLHNRKRPLPEEAAIITKILDIPIYDPSEDNSASQFFREPLNIVIGIWDDGDFNELHIDGRRIQKY